MQYLGLITILLAAGGIIGFIAELLICGRDAPGVGPFIGAILVLFCGLGAISY